jgi:hypothetical protein
MRRQRVYKGGSGAQSGATATVMLVIMLMLVMLQLAHMFCLVIYPEGTVRSGSHCPQTQTLGWWASLSLSLFFPSLSSPTHPFDVTNAATFTSRGTPLMPIISPEATAPCLRCGYMQYPCEGVELGGMGERERASFGGKGWLVQCQQQCFRSEDTVGEEVQQYHQEGCTVLLWGGRSEERAKSRRQPGLRPL